MIATTVQVAEITLPRMSTLSERVIEAIANALGVSITTLVRKS